MIVLKNFSVLLVILFFLSASAEHSLEINKPMASHPFYVWDGLGNCTEWLTGKVVDDEYCVGS